MYRILSIGIDVLAEAVILIPLLLLCSCCLFKQRNWAGRGLYMVSALYLTAVFSATGIPDIYHPVFDLSVNWIPFVDIANSPLNYIKNSILNIFLFVPAGILLPVLWEEFRKPRRMAAFGAGLSLGIELLQIFTFRLTDIDDLIMNTLGSMIGYWMIKQFYDAFQGKLWTGEGNCRQEMLVLLGVVFGIWAVLQPQLSGNLWQWMFSFNSV